MSVNRLTLDSEFYDRTSEKMLLPPEPQYLYATMLYQQVRAAELAKGAGANPEMPSGASLGSTGASVPDSGEMSPALNAAPPAYPEAVHVEDFQAQPGSTVKMNRLVFADTTYTEASRRVTRATIGTTESPITGEQVSITIERFGGPLTAAAGSVGPHIIEEFDAKRYPVHSLAERVSVHLRRDRTKTVDSILATKACTSAASTAYVYAGDTNQSLTADSSAFLTQGDRPFDLEMVFRAEQVADDASVPHFPNGRRLMLISPKQARQLKTNSRYEKMVEFHKEANPIFSRYLGTIGNSDIFVSKTNPTTTTGSITVQLGVLMGPGSLGYALAMPCQVRPDPATNFGQRVMVVWLADEGYEVLDNRFLVSLRSD